jgi:hypothetical protein
MGPRSQPVKRLRLASEQSHKFLLDEKFNMSSHLYGLLLARKGQGLEHWRLTEASHPRRGLITFLPG